MFYRNIPLKRSTRKSTGTMSSATPSDTDPPADAAEDPTIGRRREVFEDHKVPFKHYLLLVCTPSDMCVKDVSKLLVE